MSQDAQTPNNLSDTGTWRRIAVEAHTKQGWATTDRHRDRPTGRRDPLRVYARKAAIWDTVAIVAAAAIGFILRWTIPYNLNISDSTYVIFALVVVVSWSVALVIRGAYDTRVLGVVPRNSSGSLPPLPDYSVELPLWHSHSNLIYLAGSC